MPVVASPATSTQASRLRSIVVIPARFESTRLPGKPLLEIAGRAMIEHVYRRASRARSIDGVIVATDDDRVRAAVEAFGGTARLTSPAHPSGTDRLAEVAATLDCDLVVNVQGDEPFIEPMMIDDAIAPFAADPTLQMSTLRRRLDSTAEFRSPNVTKVVVDADGFALYFSRAPIPCDRQAPGALTAAAFKHIGVYVYRRTFLSTFAQLTPTPLEGLERLEQLRALEHGYRIKALETIYDSIGVDTPEDLERARALAGAAGGPVGSSRRRPRSLASPGQTRRARER